MLYVSMPVATCSTYSPIICGAMPAAYSTTSAAAHMQRIGEVYLLNPCDEVQAAQEACVTTHHEQQALYAKAGPA